MGNKSLNSPKMNGKRANGEAEPLPPLQTHAMKGNAKQKAWLLWQDTYEQSSSHWLKKWLQMGWNRNSLMESHPASVAWSGLFQHWDDQDRQTVPQLRLRELKKSLKGNEGPVPKWTGHSAWRHGHHTKYLLASWGTSACLQQRCRAQNIHEVQKRSVWGIRVATCPRKETLSWSSSQEVKH